MVEKSIFLDRRHSPMIELTKREIKIILFWLEQQVNGYWRKGGNDFDNIETIYNELNELVRNRKSQPVKWRWLKEKKSRAERQKVYQKAYRERIKQRREADK